SRKAGVGKMARRRSARKTAGAPAATHRGFGTSILVVDDDDAVRWTIGEVLRDAAYSVTLATSGADALARLRQTEFDVVLTDLRLGDVDGLAVLDAVRRTRPDAVTLMLTGYASVESAIAALRLGAY